MADKNVIRQDIVQIGFEVEDNPMQELADEMDEFKRSIAGAVDEAEDGLSDVAKLASNAGDGLEELTKEANKFAKSNIDEASEDLKDTARNAQRGADNIEDLVREAKKIKNSGIDKLDDDLDSSAKAARELAAKMKSVGDETKDAAKHGGNLKSTLGNLAKTGITGFLRGTAIAVTALATAIGMAGAGVYKTAQMASDLGEAQNVVSAVFEQLEGHEHLGGELNAFAKTVSRSYGVSATSATQYIGQISAMTTAMGIAGDEAAVMSKEIVKRSGDMASFYNLDPDEAFAKIRAGIAGETEPLKQLGVVMNETSLEAFALSQGIRKSYKDMTEAEKATLRYQFIMDKTSASAGDFADTINDSLANQTRYFKLQISEIGTSIGTIFQPAVMSAMQAINGFAGEINTLLADGWQEGDMDKLADIFTRMIDSGLEAISEGLPKVTEFVVTALNSITGVILQSAPSILTTLVSGVIELTNGIIATIQENMPLIASTLATLVTQLTSFAFQLIPQLAVIGIELVTGLLSGIAQEMPTLTKTLIDGLTMIVNSISENIDVIIEAAILIAEGLCVGLLQALPQLLEATLRLVEAVGMAIINNLPLLFEAAMSIVEALSDYVLQNLPMLLNLALEIILGLTSAILENLPLLIQCAIDLILAICQGITENIGLLVSAAIQITFGLIEGLINNLPLLIDAAIQIISAIVLGLIQAIPLLLECGYNIMFGFADALISIDWSSFSLDNILLKLVEGIKSGFTTLVDTGGQSIQKIIDGFTACWQNVTQSGCDLIIKFVSGIFGEQSSVTTTVTSICDEILSVFDGVSLTEVGSNIINSLKDGINNAKDALFEKATSIANTIKDKIEDALKINSPSKVMIQDGMYTGDGLAEGLERSKPNVDKAATAMADTAISAADNSLGYTPETSSVSTVNNSSSNVSEVNNFNPVFNLTINGDGDRALERKVRAWIKESMEDVFDSVTRTNPRLTEV